MNFSEFHFAYPYCLLLILAIPLIGILFFLFYQTKTSNHHLEKFIDRHLLNHLLIHTSKNKSSPWKNLLLWSAVWLSLTLALAGPRWSFREIESFSRDQSLVILLDLSESMNAVDVKPSRLARAKQKIEDLMNLSKGVKIALIAFAADPHMITPLTDDKEMIRHLLPSLQTDLVYVQGSQLSSALEMASSLLENELGNNKAILVISDGGFEDTSAISTAKKISGMGVTIHAMGIGTPEGAPILDHQGNSIKTNGTAIISKIEKERLSEISRLGKGHYFEANYSNEVETIILRELEKEAKAQVIANKKNRLWDEHFYLFILPILPIVLWWFKRGYLFITLLILCFPIFDIKAIDLQDYFQTSEESGKQAFDEGHYEIASNKFQDPYRRGVACYKAGNYVEAEKMFHDSIRADVASNAAYNLGNSLAQQEKLKEAITVYEELLKKWPDHTQAKDNLELVKKMLEEQKKNSNDEKSDQQDKSDKEDQEESEKGGGNNDQKTEDQKTGDQKDNPSNNENPNEKIEKGQNQENGPQDEETQQKEIKEDEASQDNKEESNKSRSQEDLDADLWLNQLSNDPKQFLKNKFYIESKKNETKKGIDPW
jgi:Ca-activated chloride channel homolog